MSAEAAELIRKANRIVVVTGAGMSAESGVPTFRDALTGLWERFDHLKLSTPEAWDEDPALVWGWYEWRRAAVERVQPNAGHHALAALGERATIVTQNVDDLHERAGSADPVHLHGSLFAARCSACEAPYELGPADEPAEGRKVTPPACAVCGGAVRPGVVWFGEMLPPAALEAAVEAAATCDLLLTVGTSGVVYPAAEIPQVAAKLGACVIQVNPEPTPLDEFCALNLRGTAATVLPGLVGP